MADLLYAHSTWDDAGPVVTVRAQTPKGEAWVSSNGGADGLYLIEKEHFDLVLACAEGEGLTVKAA